MVMDVKTTAELLAIFQRYGVQRARLGPDGSAEFEFTGNPPSLYPQPVESPYTGMGASDTPEESEQGGATAVRVDAPTADSRRALSGLRADDPLFDGVER